MTIKQSLLKYLYPFIRKLSGIKSKGGGMQLNLSGAPPVESFYALQAKLANGSTFEFSSLAGKMVMLVNVASNCGFTAQYAELESLTRQYRSRLVVLGFPANDFKGQEPGTDEDIENFCKVNYGVSFAIFTKAPVVKPHQQPVFDWLSSKSRNGWNDVQPSWNFCKYLVDEKGRLAGSFMSHI
jgi:glutathione peroxidase